jgi:hypothetical protein
LEVDTSLPSSVQLLVVVRTRSMRHVFVPGLLFVFFVFVIWLRLSDVVVVLPISWCVPVCFKKKSIRVKSFNHFFIFYFLLDREHDPSVHKRFLEKKV